MEDRDFIDMLLQGMKDTTHAEDGYWGFERVERPLIDAAAVSLPPTFVVFYVTANDPDTKHAIGSFDHEADAAFVTAIHGAFPDLWRRLHMALDEADEKDRKADDAEQVAGTLARALAECQQAYARAEVSEDWHGKVAGT